MLFTLRWVCVSLLLCSACIGQEPQTRAEQIELTRVEKSRRLEPDTLTGVERVLQEIKQKRIVERFTEGVAGWRVRLGSLVTGSGMALGPEYERSELFGGRADFRTNAVFSIRKYMRIDTRFRMPQLAGDHVFFEAGAAYRNYPGINYYGPGPNSSKNGRSAYRLENTSLGFSAGVKPISHLRMGVEGDYLLINVGPGSDSRFVSTERIYSPRTTPGLDQQSDFMRGGPFIQFDYRDQPGGPRSGGNYVAKYSYFSDRKMGQYSFRVIDLEAQQYIPFFNERRVIALRAKTVLTDTNHLQRVPFYLQPTLGGSETLRGFRSFRFYDDNLLVLNAEYRWEVFSGLDMALFYDTGKVFSDWAKWNLADLEDAYGFGFRFNVRNSVFMRTDFGFSREGFQAWVKFDNVF